MAKHIEYIDKTAFKDEDSAEIMQYIHALNGVSSGGEFTLCGNAFNGDGVDIENIPLSSISDIKRYLDCAASKYDLIKHIIK